MDPQEQAGVQDPAAQSAESQGAVEQGGYDKGDYIARIKNEPDFAAEQVREKDKKYTELQGRHKQLEPLEEYVRVAGGSENLIRHVDLGVFVGSNPQLMEAVETVRRTGQLPEAQPTGQADDDDPYTDPEIKELRTMVRELTASNESLQVQVNQRFAQADARSMKAGIDQNVDAVIQKYAVTDDLKQKIVNAIGSQVSEAERSVNSADPAVAERSRQLLEMLHGDKGQETLLRMIAPTILEDDALRTIVQAKESSRVETVANQDTGAPSRVRTAGGDPQAQELTYSPNLVRDALARNLRRDNRDPVTYSFAPRDTTD